MLHRVLIRFLVQQDPATTYCSFVSMAIGVGTCVSSGMVFGTKKSGKPLRQEEIFKK